MLNAVERQQRRSVPKKRPGANGVHRCQRTYPDRSPDINITPLVDVVLVLLIIFMVTAPVLQSGIELPYPRPVR